MNKTLKLFFVLISIYFIPYTNIFGQEQDGLGRDDSGIRGLIRPKEQAILSSEIAGKITRLPLRSGQQFKRNELLAEFDCGLYESELSSANAQYDALNKRYKNNEALLALNATSDIEVEISKAETKKAYADVRAATIRAERCKIKAPYDGRVIELLVNQFESVATDQKLLSILNDSELEIELIVPSRWLGWLKQGVEFDFRVDETSETHRAKVLQLGAVVDPVSQTIRITGIFIDNTDNILSGMSGTAQLHAQ